MRRSASTRAEFTAKPICRAIAATTASFPVWRRCCRERRSGSPVIWRGRIRPRRRFWRPEISRRSPEFQQHQDLAEQHLGDWQGLDRRTFLMNRRQEPDSFWYADCRRTRAERRKLRRSRGAGRHRDRARHRGSPRQRHCRCRAWRHDSRGHRHCSRPAAARRVRLHDRQLLANPSRPLSRPARLRVAGHDDQSPAVIGRQPRRRTLRKITT